MSKHFRFNITGHHSNAATIHFAMDYGNDGIKIFAEEKMTNTLFHIDTSGDIWIFPREDGATRLPYILNKYGEVEKVNEIYEIKNTYVERSVKELGDYKFEIFDNTKLPTHAIIIDHQTFYEISSINMETHRVALHGHQNTYTFDELELLILKEKE